MGNEGNMILGLIGFRRGTRQIHLYDFVFLAVAGAIVFPDKVLEWVSDRTGKIFGWWHLIALDLLAVGTMIVATVILLPVYPKLNWWEPLIFVGVLAATRLGVWLAVKLFGFDD